MDGLNLVSFVAPSRPARRASRTLCSRTRADHVTDPAIHILSQAGMTYAEISGMGGKESEELYPVRPPSVVALSA